MRNRVLSTFLAGMLFFAAGAGVACDKEDRKDVKEVGKNIEKGVDDLDSDGKDD